MTRYGYAHVISGFFEFPTDNARRILPRHLEPVEPHHGTSIFSFTAFDFDDSQVGPYREVFLSVIVAPLVKPGQRLPKSAFYPFVVATNRREPREHAIELWHLPHWMDDVEIAFESGAGSMTARVRADGAPVADLTIYDHSWNAVEHLYQSFMKDERGAYLANVTMQGQESEHEDERGRLVLHDHLFNRDIDIAEVYEVPFRELWMRSGVQTFDPLIQLQTA